MSLKINTTKSRYIVKQINQKIIKTQTGNLMWTKIHYP